MKTLFTLLFVFLFSAGSFAQKDEAFKMLRIDSTFYADQMEITVGEWLYYLTDRAAHSPRDQWKQFLPDTSMLPKDCRPLFEVALTHVKGKDKHIMRSYSFNINSWVDVSDTLHKEIEIARGNRKMNVMRFPIAGITHEQALDYCVWRTNTVNKMLNEDSRAAKRLDVRQVTFRLPTPEEFEHLSHHQNAKKKHARKLDPEHIDWPVSDSSQGGQSCKTWNYFNEDTTCNYVKRQAELFGWNSPVETGTYGSSMHGLYDLLGNVAEMTSQKGMAKGGSCTHSAAACLPRQSQSYTQPAKWLGFRCVAVIEPLKDKNGKTMTQVALAN